MILELDESFNAVTDWGTYAEALHAIFEAHRTGRHMVLASRDLLNKLIESGQLGPVLEKSAKQVIQKYSEFFSIANAAGKRILIYDYALTKFQPAVPNKIPVEISFFKLDHVLDHFGIVVEHETHDGELLKLLAGPVAGHLKLPAASFDMIFIHGGGSSIAEVIKGLQKKNSPFFVISDSDRMFPTDTPKGTAKKVIEAMGGYTSKYGPLVGYKILSVHEIENFLPIEILDELVRGTEQIAAMALLKKLTPNWPNCSPLERDLWAYLDLKKGKDIATATTADEMAHYTVICTRLGRNSYPGISEELAKILCGHCSDERNLASLKRTFSQILPKSPFWDDIRNTLTDIISASVRNPYRV